MRVPFLILLVYEKDSQRSNADVVERHHPLQQDHCNLPYTEPLVHV